MYGISNSTSAFYRRSLQQMNDLRADAERLQAQVSSGERLAQSSDDPVAASRLRALARADRLAGVDAAHAAQASEELGQGAEAIQDIANAVIRARELALWAATETLSDAERAGIAEEKNTRSVRSSSMSTKRCSASAATNSTLPGVASWRCSPTCSAALPAIT